MPNPGETVPGKLPAFAPDSADIRQADWTVAAGKGKDDVIVIVDSIDKTFGLEELLHAQRDAAVTLHVDADGYLFSYVQAFSDRPECVLPDRADINFSSHCLRSLARHVQDVGSRRGAKVAAAPAVEPGLFFAGDQRVVAADLLQVPRGRITEHGIRQNIRTVLQGIAVLLADQAPPGNRNEIELCRAQLWQWVQHETGVLDTGQIVTPALFATCLGEELAAAEDTAAAAESAQLQQAASLLDKMTRAATLAPSMVDEAYRLAD